MEQNNELRKLINSNEKILYEGKPGKKCFVFESIFNPLLPFALLWAFIDFSMLGAAFTQTADDQAAAFMIPFLILHMMPVWIYLGGVLLTFSRYRNTYYIVTDKAIYASEGVFNKLYKTKPFAELSHVDLHRGIFDQMFNVGDIITTSNQTTIVPSSGAYGNRNRSYSGITINSISNYAEVYNIISKLQQDIYTDTMYPNDLRPKENHGYNTEYKGM